MTSRNIPSVRKAKAKPAAHARPLPEPSASPDWIPGETQLQRFGLTAGPVGPSLRRAAGGHRVSRGNHLRPGDLSPEQAAEMFARRLTLTREERIMYLKAAPKAVYSAETMHRFLLRRWSKICPDCGRAEAGSPYCSGCLLPMKVDDWFDRRSKPLAPMSDAYRAQLLRSYGQPSEEAAAA